MEGKDDSAREALSAASRRFVEAAGSLAAAIDVDVLDAKAVPSGRRPLQDLERSGTAFRDRALDLTTPFGERVDDAFAAIVRDQAPERPGLFRRHRSGSHKAASLWQTLVTLSHLLAVLDAHRISVMDLVAPLEERIERLAAAAAEARVLVGRSEGTDEAARRKASLAADDAAAGEAALALMIADLRFVDALRVRVRLDIEKGVLVAAAQGTDEFGEEADGYLADTVRLHADGLLDAGDIDRRRQRAIEAVAGPCCAG